MANEIESLRQRLNQESSSKSKRHPRGKVIHVFSGSGLFEKISREKMGVVGGERQMLIKTPFQHCFYLMADVTSIAGFPGLNNIYRRAIDAVVCALAPKAIPIQIEANVF